MSKACTVLWIAWTCIIFPNPHNFYAAFFSFNFLRISIASIWNTSDGHFGRGSEEEKSDKAKQQQQQFISSLARKKWFIYRTISRNAIHRKFIGVDVCTITHIICVVRKRDGKKLEIRECKCVCVVTTTTGVVKKCLCVKCQEK